MELVTLLSKSLVFYGLENAEIQSIALKASVQVFKKGECVFKEQDACNYFYIVAEGLIKVFTTSPNGTRVTYLIAQAGEPINLIAPFTQNLRPVVAEALKESSLIKIKTDDFLEFALKKIKVITNIIGILGQALDSSNSRIIDMMEKKVEQRLFRALYSLYQKFGTPLKFTSLELSNLIGATTESTLRSISILKQEGIIKTSRGKIDVLKPKELEQYDVESLWI